MANTAFQKKGSQNPRLWSNSTNHSSRVGHLGPLEKSDRLFKSTKPVNNNRPTQSKSFFAKGSVAGNNHKLGDGVPGFKTSFDVSGKSGGAFRPISENFSVNPANGTMSLGIPIRCSPTRGGFGPSLNLSYDSGAGSGAFGFGWAVSVPSFSLKTNLGIPRYCGEDDVLYGGVDILPFLDDMGKNVEEKAEGYTVTKYRPRIDSRNTKMQKWVQISTGEVHWRTISGENVTSIFGESDDNRIFHGTGAQKRVFSWLLAKSFDAHGNAVEYVYKAENGKGIADEQGVSPLYEQTRAEDYQYTQRYLKRIKYGNKTSPRDLETWHPSTWPKDWMFEIVFDYGDHNRNNPGSSDLDVWPVRQDPFSSCHSGFEIRTYRLCKRILMFHHFLEELEAEETLVSSQSFEYSESAVCSLLTHVKLESHASSKQNQPNKSPSSVTESLPPWTFEYTQIPDFNSMKMFQASSYKLVNPPNPKSVSQWLDLEGEGLPGLLNKLPDGNLSYQRSRGLDNDIVSFDEVRLLEQQVNLLDGNNSLNFQDLDRNGHLDLIIKDVKGNSIGYYERQDSDSWSNYSDFSSTTSAETHADVVHSIDLTGDGFQDKIYELTSSRELVWRQTLQKNGVTAQKVTFNTYDQRLPRLQDTISTRTYISDMSGDGLSDLVEITDSNITYWPNLGWGAFGNPVTMASPPYLARYGIFDHNRIQLIDIDGTGTTDIIYILPNGGAVLFFNQAGNSWSDGILLNAVPKLSSPSSIFALDIKGNGTACLCWSEDLNTSLSTEIQYIDLMNGLKPHLLKGYNNGMGGTTAVTYAPSTRFYLEDRFKGQPWTSKLPFPVQIVSTSKTTDHITGKVVTSDYRYRNGSYDPLEKQFAGFEMVEQITYEKMTIGPDEVWDSFPTLTKSWFNVGLNLRVDDSQFFNKSQIQSLSHVPSNQHIPGSLLPLRGASVRTEVYSLDGTDKAHFPFSIEERSYDVKLLQSKGHNKYAVFQMHPRAGITTQFDRNLSDPKISSDIALKTDQFGNVEEFLEVVYPRDPTALATIQYQDVVDNQKAGNMSFVRSCVTDSVDEVNNYRTPLVRQHQNFEIIGYSFKGLIDVDQIREYDFLALPHQRINTPWKHLRTEELITFKSSDMTSILPAQKLEAFSLVHQTYALAFTPNILDKYKASQTSLDISIQSVPFTGKSSPTEAASSTQKKTFSLEEALQKGGYLQIDHDSKKNWWIPSTRVYFSIDKLPINELKIARKSFYVPTIAEDAFGNCSYVQLDDNLLLVTETEDTMGNTVHFENDYTHLQSYSMMDANLNFNEALLDIMGRTVAIATLGKNKGAEDEDSLTALSSRWNGSDAFAILSDPLGETTMKLLGNAGSRVVHYTDAYYTWSLSKRESLKNGAQNQQNPPANFSITISRDLAFRQSEKPMLQIEVAFFDGFGNVIQQATLNDPADFGKEWIISGHTISGGGISRTYQPFFSSTPQLVPVAEIKTFASTSFQDATGRPIASLSADNLWSKMVYTSWAVTEHDVGDLLLSDPCKDADLAHFFAKIKQPRMMPSWYKLNMQGSQYQQAAAKKSETYVECPQVTHIGSCGLAVRQVHMIPGNIQTRAFVYDYSGNRISDEDSKGRVTEKNSYDKLNRALSACGMDSGESWSLEDVRGGTILSWNSRGICFQFEYDKLGRELQKWMHVSASTPKLVVQTEYGKLSPENQVLNRTGQITSITDQSGVYTHEGYDVRGHDIKSIFQPAKQYKAVLDWNFDIKLENTKYPSSASFDSKGQIMQQTDSHGNVTKRIYSRHGQVIQVDFRAAEQSQWTSYLTATSFTVDGLPARIEYGNGVSTELMYDAKTRELLSQTTTRAKRGQTFAFDDFPSPRQSRQLAGKQERRSRSTQTLIEEYSYTYDCCGRLVRVFDGSEQAKYFRNNKVLAKNEYTYNTLGQIVSATGRANLPSQQRDVQLIPHSSKSGFDPNRSTVDGNKMYEYLESYTYDCAGNMKTMKHEAIDDPLLRGWTRHFAYNEPSLLSDDSKITSNRLSQTLVASNVEQYKYDGEENEPYTYDYLGDAGKMGCMTSIPKYSRVTWNMSNLMASSSTQSFKNGVAETTYYVYNHSGDRVRKITEGSCKNGETAPVRRDTLFLSSVEVQLKYSKNYGCTTRKIARISGDGHIADVESVHRQKTVSTAEQVDGGNDELSDDSSTNGDSDIDNDDSIPLVRYRIGSSMELDDKGQLVSYEEYSPFGSAVFSVQQDSIEAPRTYRFARYEHDRETGLYHCGARYYCPWLGRWTSPDPLGDIDGPNLYLYCANDPINSTDHQGTSRQGGTPYRVDFSAQERFRGSSRGRKLSVNTTYTNPTASSKGRSRNATPDTSTAGRGEQKKFQIRNLSQATQGSNKQGWGTHTQLSKNDLNPHVHNHEKHAILSNKGIIHKVEDMYNMQSGTMLKPEFYKYERTQQGSLYPTSNLLGGAFPSGKGKTSNSHPHKAIFPTKPNPKIQTKRADYLEQNHNFIRKVSYAAGKLKEWFGSQPTEGASGNKAIRGRKLASLNNSIDKALEVENSSDAERSQARTGMINSYDSSFDNCVSFYSGKASEEMKRLSELGSEMKQNHDILRAVEAKTAKDFQKTGGL